MDRKGLTSPHNKSDTQADAPTEQPDAMLRDEDVAAVRPVLKAVARMIATDRRAVVLATSDAEILLANPSANQLELNTERLRDLLDWPNACAQARRAGSITISLEVKDLSLDGELVRLPLGRATGYLLRLSESDQESTWLRNRARAATLMRVAHDLRTPIQSLLLNSEALLDPDQRDHVEFGQIRRAADQALAHVSNVLAVIRGEQSAAGLQPDETFSLVDELEGLLSIMQPIAKARGAVVRSSVHSDDAPQVVGPVKFVRALLQNMIDNSVKYGGACIDVTLTATPLPPSLDPQNTQEHVSITVEVRDLGGGLPADQKQRLKHALGRPDTRQRKGQSAGGMNVLAHAVTQLGGHIEILDRGENDLPVSDANAPVIGTMLRATFSLRQATSGESTEKATSPNRPNSEDAALTGRRILLVEDSPSSKDWFEHVLTGAGAQVQAVSSAHEALALLHGAAEGEMPELVMTDVTLPNMNGIELARKIREAGRSGQIPWHGRIVGLTAHVDEKIRQACFDAGMLRVLEKPIRPTEICGVIKEVLATQAIPEVPKDPMQPRTESLAAYGSLLEKTVIADLMSQLGRDGAENFLTRALAETESALQALKDGEPSGESWRKLHAATGACGLTGLSELEKCLRQLENVVQANDPTLTTLLEATEKAMLDSTIAIRTLLA